MTVTVSVTTPSHSPRWLDECYLSLLRQTAEEWEWVVALPRDVEWFPPRDPRVHLVRSDEVRNGVGAAKRFAVSQCSGALLLELDHDDKLTPTAIEQVAEVFERDEDAVLVYSDFAQINGDGSPNFDEFDRAKGWGYVPVTIDGIVHHRCLALEPSQHNTSLIWFAPNHLRAFRKDAYERVGGYDADLKVLDDQDLMMRLFKVGKFVRIPECLYLQRWHPHNTQRERETNAFIQAETVRRYWAEAQLIETLDIVTLDSEALGALWEDMLHGDLLPVRVEHRSHVWHYVHEQVKQALFPDAKWRFQLGDVRDTDAILVAIKDDGPRQGGTIYS